MTLTPRQWRQVLYCCAEELRERRSGKVPGIQPWNAELVRVVELELATSADGTESDSAEAESDTKALIDTAQAAQILRCSTRYIRDIAEDKLGGQRIGKRWLFNEDEVFAYAEGRSNDGRAAG